MALGGRMDLVEHDIAEMKSTLVKELRQFTRRLRGEELVKSR